MLNVGEFGEFLSLSRSAMTGDVGYVGEKGSYLVCEHMCVSG